MTDYMQKARELTEAEPFQNGDWSMERLHRRVHARTLEALDTERAAHEATKAELQALRERHERLLIATAASVKTSMDEYKRGEMDGRRHGLSQGLELSARVAIAAQYSKAPATDTLRGIKKLIDDQAALTRKDA